MEKVITIPNRDKDGWLHGTIQVIADWKCPVCGNPMGEPKLQQFCEDGEFYSVHTWSNDCGHVCKYTDLKIVSRPIISASGIPIPDDGHDAIYFSR